MNSLERKSHLYVRCLDPERDDLHRIREIFADGMFEVFPFLKQHIIDYVNNAYKEDLKDMESIKRTYLNRDHSPKGNFWVLVERKLPLLSQGKNSETIENNFDHNDHKDVVGSNATSSDEFQVNSNAKGPNKSTDNMEEIIHGTLALQYIDDTTAELRRMSISKEFRRRGFATHLLVDFLIPFAEQQGYKKIILSTQEMMISARKLYENNQFQLVREKVLEEKLAIPNPTTGKTELVILYYEKLLEKRERDQ